MTADLRTAPAAPPPPPPPPPVGASAVRALQLFLGLVLIVAGVVGSVWLWGVTSLKITETRTVHPAVGTVVLDLRANGSVEIVAHDGDEIVVDQRTETIFREVDATQTIAGDELRLASARCRGPLDWFSHCGASFVVHVPAPTAVSGSLRHGAVSLTGLQAQADVRTGHGGVDALDVAGPLDLHTSHGAIRVEGAGGDVTVRTGHGAVWLTDVAGDAAAVTSHGAIRALRVAGALQATTGHGAIEAVGTTGDVVTLETSHGAVELAPANAPSQIDVSTGHGAVTVSLPPDAPAYAAEDVWTSHGTVDVRIATDPASSHRMSVMTHHGAIHVDYAGR